MNITTKLKINALAFACIAILMGFQSTSPAYHPEYDVSVDWHPHPVTEVDYPTGAGR